MTPRQGLSIPTSLRSVVVPPAPLRRSAPRVLLCLCLPPTARLLCRTRLPRPPRFLPSRPCARPLAPPRRRPSPSFGPRSARERPPRTWLPRHPPFPVVPEWAPFSSPSRSSCSSLCKAVRGGGGTNTSAPCVQSSAFSSYPSDSDRGTALRFVWKESTTHTSKHTNSLSGNKRSGTTRPPPQPLPMSPPSPFRSSSVRPTPDHRPLALSQSPTPPSNPSPLPAQ